MKKIIISLILLLSMVLVVGCDNNKKDNNEDKLIVEQAMGEIVIAETINSSIDLPSTDKSGKVQISWKSSNNEILDASGRFFMPEETQGVVLTATFKYNEETVIKDYSVLCAVETKYPFNLAYKMLAGTIKDEYVIDTKFSNASFRTYSMKVESLNPEVITNEGVLNKTDVDQMAILKITITNSENNESQVYYKRVVIKQWTNQVFIEKIAEWAQEKVNQYVRGDIDKLPTTHEKYPSEIKWIGGNQTFIDKNGEYIVRPVEYVDDVIKAQIKYGESIITKELTLENFGGNTEEGFLEEFLTYLIPTEIKAHHNYVYKEYGDEYYLHHQVEVNTGGVLNLIDGKDIYINQTYYNDIAKNGYKNKIWYNTTHRGVGSGVSQATLDEYFGEGYVIPNEENIFWIVVHESGMPLPGQDAQVLAELQYNNVNVSDSYREASWHYQVDEGVIYQSFDDNFELWHAGGTYTWLSYGNTNSIGIEMCINADGNYDGSMRHDAKLVAHLMHKYNLGIQNVKRHYDFAGKECPSYMIRTDRYNEFIEYVNQEYYAMKYLKDCEVTWTVSDLDTLFDKGANGLYYAKAVTTPTDVTITLNVKKGSFTFNKSVTITLEPDTIDLSIWALD